MAVPPPASSKATLRRALRDERVRFIRNDEAIVARMLAAIGDLGTIGGYVAQRGEPDISPILSTAIRRGHAIALPRVNDGTMTFVGWNGVAPLVPGYSGIPEPHTGNAIVPDTLLMPLLGFDRAGRRLGQGGGFYDRWCAAHRHVRRIGIAWSVQEVAELPEEPWDVRLDAIVTEREWITP